MQNFRFPWSDNWWIEDDKAWFCAGEIGALFCVDMYTERCDLVARIPECEIIQFRSFSYCIRYRNEIFCLPSIGKCIWCYNPEKFRWEKIEVENNSQIFICMSSYKRGDKKMFCWDEEGKIFEIDFAEKKIREYCIPESCKEGIGEYILRENKLYSVWGKRVYCINTDSREWRSYEISNVRTSLYTICHDGSNFWLSGFDKVIYIWNPKHGTVKAITEFPQQFGIYDFSNTRSCLIDCESITNATAPYFYSSVPLGDYIWFIPFQSNKILYIDKKSYKVLELEVDGEQETRESLGKNYLSAKYLVEYIREGRYIGLYSVKNHYIFEIDTVELRVIKRSYYLTDETVLLIKKTAVDYDKGKLLREASEMERTLFTILLKKKVEKTKCVSENMGEMIYNVLNE